MSGLSFLYVCAVVFSMHLFRRVFLRNRRKGLPLPPGPRGYPLVGNIYDDFGKHPWIAYKELSSRYKSDIVCLNMAGTPLVIINSQKAATELFEKRSATYSDRPSFVMQKLSGLTYTFGMREYGSFWKESRTLFHSTFQPPALLQYYPEITAACRALLQKLLNDPSAYMSHLRHMTGNIILSAAYGIDVQATNDPYVNLAERALAAVTLVTRPGTYFVDSLPWMRHIPRWCPGATFQRDAQRYRKDITAAPQVTLDFVKCSMVDGIARPSIASRYLREMEDNSSWTPEKEEVLRGVLGSMYLAGSDTTVCALASFILAMVLYPNVQQRAQGVVDATVGTLRLPELSDRKSMPYIEAILQEVLRWKLVTPLGIAHASSSDDVYNGYYIPKGSTVVGNSWAILHDKSVYGEDTDRFRPDRFMEGLDLDPNMPKAHAAFGFGRRMCAGRDSAEASIWITIASLLATFHFSGKSTEEKDYGDYGSGFMSYPPHFQCEIRPRSTQAIALIRESLQE